jgi:hypothetical protein
MPLKVQSRFLPSALLIEHLTLRNCLAETNTLKRVSSHDHHVSSFACQYSFSEASRELSEGQDCLHLERKRT